MDELVICERPVKRVGSVEDCRTWSRDGGRVATLDESDDVHRYRPDFSWINLWMIVVLLIDVVGFVVGFCMNAVSIWFRKSLDKLLQLKRIDRKGTAV